MVGARIYMFRESTCFGAMKHLLQDYRFTQVVGILYQVLTLLLLTLVAKQLCSKDSLLKGLSVVNYSVFKGIVYHL